MPNEFNQKKRINFFVDAETKQLIEDLVPWGLKNKFIGGLIKTFLETIRDEETRDQILARILTNEINPEELKRILMEAKLHGNNRESNNSVPPPAV
jgi:hypothetical protein